MKLPHASVFFAPLWWCAILIIVLPTISSRPASTSRGKEVAQQVTDGKCVIDCSGLGGRFYSGWLDATQQSADFYKEHIQPKMHRFKVRA
ncbi:hypothetical protein IE81DRAFT_320310 [Ceraceosorus guamensis]|uniref:Uncharacterized protein n=1 Tax=Ceraceosorus guamensis TaxID=1522189 RepID=A0A316W7I3_9BASI|nr:hypothetical protein IE81DRAFT_320310 [Ceraceosorus guamensis]PWN45544.1 hypothetical protein IE81DRAFT_320310 [Ceraceosorus guamensis]